MTQDAPGITQLGNDSCVEIYHRPQCWGYRPGERMRRKGRRVSRSQKEDHLLPIPPHLKQRCVTVRCVSHSGHGGMLEPHAMGHHKGVRCQPVAENVSQYILKYASRHQNSLPVPRPRQWRGQKTVLCQDTNYSHTEILQNKQTKIMLIILESKYCSK